MASIRPLERGDLPAVAELIRAHVGWRRDPEVLERTLLDHPWTRPEPTTLVAVDEEGRVIGSIGAQERPIAFDGAKLRGVCVSHLVVDPEQRAGAAGALLVRTLLGGDQDVTFTDSGTEDVVRIWAAFGADVDHSRTGGWMIVTRPARWMAGAGWDTLRRGERRRRVPTAALPVHMAGRRVIPRAFPQPPPDVQGADASPGEIADVVPSLRGIRVRVDYDEAYLSWLFAHVSSLGAPLSHRIVSRGGRPIGWYAYIRRETARLIHLAAVTRQAEAVFSEFAAHAREHGAVALAGRVEPNLDEPLRSRMAAISLAQRPLIHARDPELRAALGSSAALLTEMDLIDSEWW